ncbi:hypothetical protein BDV36DRAFT_250395 [Aspergillus pseudocaelatus]|uniref:Uncharacterized protein n=1 Tax=Aspergillus pseudocaelatus TaxID=1825620 RepID=A0ABQ6WSN3_9EURO|nr:hypothetical protein BDV36DRAFT_250395 [Aspergillus pseudocaelatus]
MIIIFLGKILLCSTRLKYLMEAMNKILHPLFRVFGPVQHSHIGNIPQKDSSRRILVAQKHFEIS